MVISDCLRTKNTHTQKTKTKKLNLLNEFFDHHPNVASHFMRRALLCQVRL